MENRCCCCVCCCKISKCRTHICLDCRRKCFPEEPKPRCTQPIADCNGRFFNRQNACSFPWSNFLMQQWLQPSCTCTKTGRQCQNACGRQHRLSNTYHLPRHSPNSTGKVLQLQSNDDFYDDPRLSNNSCDNGME